ncbi:ER lumen protein-retaining receptor [Aphelenchoides fujianensis]|nr:ER lumen protein-retaining receptor [Aphelenchoides fujianensis]
MNVFRLFADFTHLFAFVFLLAKIFWSRSVAGISGRTQLLLALTFSARYADLFTTYVSAYNTTMKCIYLACVWSTCFLVYGAFRKTGSWKHDRFPAGWLVLFAAGVAFLFSNAGLPFFLGFPHYEEYYENGRYRYGHMQRYDWNRWRALTFRYNGIELLWAFSETLEALAIIPQLYLLYKRPQAIERSMLVWLGLLGVYRFEYCLNWIYRSATESHFDPYSNANGALQTAIFFIAGIYCAFVYVERRCRWEYERLPAPYEQKEAVWNTNDALLQPRTIAGILAAGGAETTSAEKSNGKAELPRFQ